MKINETFRAAAVAIGCYALLAGRAALAADEVVDEIVVHGARGDTVPVLDMASLRVDVKQHARSLGRSVREALGDKRSEAQVAAAEGRTRG
jgi:hypothetical protein